MKGEVYFDGKTLGPVEDCDDKLSVYETVIHGICYGQFLSIRGQSDIVHAAVVVVPQEGDFHILYFIFTYSPVLREYTPIAFLRAERGGRIPVRLEIPCSSVRWVE